MSVQRRTFPSAHIAFGRLNGTAKNGRVFSGSQLLKFEYRTDFYGTHVGKPDRIHSVIVAVLT